MWRWSILKEIALYAIREHKLGLFILLSVLLLASWLMAASEASLIAPYLYPLF